MYTHKHRAGESAPGHPCRERTAPPRYNRLPPAGPGSKAREAEPSERYPRHRRARAHPAPVPPPERPLSRSGRRYGCSPSLNAKLRPGRVCGQQGVRPAVSPGQAAAAPRPGRAAGAPPYPFPADPAEVTAPPPRLVPQGHGTPRPGSAAPSRPPAEGVGPPALGETPTHPSPPPSPASVLPAGCCRAGTHRGRWSQCW